MADVKAYDKKGAIMYNSNDFSHGYSKTFIVPKGGQARYDCKPGSLRDHSFAWLTGKVDENMYYSTKASCWAGKIGKGGFNTQQSWADGEDVTP